MVCKTHIKSIDTNNKIFTCTWKHHISKNQVTAVDHSHFYYYSHPFWGTDVDKFVGTLPLKKEKPTMVTEITWNWQAPVLSHLSKGHSPRSPVACQYAFWQIPVSLLYDLLSTNSGVLLGRLWLKQRRMVRSDTDVPWPWSSPLISLEVVLGSLVTIRIICLFNLS